MQKILLKVCLLCALDANYAERLKLALKEVAGLKQLCDNRNINKCRRSGHYWRYCIRGRNDVLEHHGVFPMQAHFFANFAANADISALGGRRTSAS